MKKIKACFDKYVMQFNISDKEIKEKYDHSYRVMDYSIAIATSLNMSKEDIRVVAIASLFHDIARFEQWISFKTWQTKKSFDHGDRGYKILKEGLIDNLVHDEQAKKIILLAVKNHNKYKVEDGLTEKQLLISNIIRDADKIDIIQTQGIINKKYIIKDELIECLFRHEMINNNLIENDLDYLFRLVAFIFDLNFAYSYKYLLDKKIIENKISLIEKYGNKNLESLKNDLISYIKERQYVRKEI